MSLCVQIDQVALLADDLLVLERKEKRGELARAQLNQVAHLVEQLRKAEKVVKDNVFHGDKGRGEWLRLKAWLLKQTWRRDEIHTDIIAARDAVDRAAQGLNLSLTIFLVDSPAESKADDAQQLRSFMHQHDIEPDDDTRTILQHLEASSDVHDSSAVEQAQELAAQMLQRMVGEESKQELSQQLCHAVETASQLSFDSLSSLPPAGPSSRSLPALQVREFVLGESVQIDAPRVQLGKGGGGHVLMAKCRLRVDSDEWSPCAFKHIDIDPDLDEQQGGAELASLRREAQIMWLLNGQTNILRLYGVCYGDRPGLVFELCNRGTLQQWLWTEVKASNAQDRLATTGFVSNDELMTRATTADAGQPSLYAQQRAKGAIQGCLDLSQRLLFCQELLSAVAYLHGRHFAHGDIKSSNVLVHELGRTAEHGAGLSEDTPPLLCLRLCDFGSVSVMRSISMQVGSTLLRSAPTGHTLRWSAPELQMAAPHHTEPNPDRAEAAAGLLAPSSVADERSADVYSLGLVIAELFTSLPPYAWLVSSQVHHALYTRMLPYGEVQLQSVSPALLRLVQRCTAHAHSRASLAELKYRLWPQLMASLLSPTSNASSRSLTPSVPGASSSASTSTPSTPSPASTTLSSPPSPSPSTVHPHHYNQAGGGPQPAPIISAAPSPATSAPAPIGPPLPVHHARRTVASMSASPVSAEQSSKAAQGDRQEVLLRYEHDFDKCGLFHYLGTRGGTQPWQNPCTAGLVTVTCSALSKESEPCSALVTRGGLGRCITLNEPNQWFCIDLHSARFSLSCYTMGLPGVVHWKLEGSSDGVQWDTLDAHTSRRTTQSRTWRVQSAPLSPSRWCRYFRIQQTGLDCRNHHALCVNGIELYGTLLLLTSPASSSASPSPTSSTSTTVVPSMVAVRSAASAGRAAPCLLEQALYTVWFMLVTSLAAEYKLSHCICTALRVLRDARLNGVRLEEDVFVRLLKACGASIPGRSVELMSMMQECGYSVDEVVYGQLLLKRGREAEGILKTLGPTAASDSREREHVQGCDGSLDPVHSAIAAPSPDDLARFHRNFTAAYPHLTIDTSDRCPECRRQLSDEEIRAGWTDRTTDYTTACPRCGERFAAQLVVSTNPQAAGKVTTPLSSSHQGPETEAEQRYNDQRQLQGAQYAALNAASRITGSDRLPLTLPYLPPRVLKKEVGRLMEEHGIGYITHPSFRLHSTTLYWNLAWHLLCLALPVQLLLWDMTEVERMRDGEMEMVHVMRSWSAEERERRHTQRSGT